MILDPQGKGSQVEPTVNVGGSFRLSLIIPMPEIP